MSGQGFDLSCMTALLALQEAAQAEEAAAMARKHVQELQTRFDERTAEIEAEAAQLDRKVGNMSEFICVQP